MKRSIFTLLITAFTFSSAFTQTSTNEDESDFTGFEKGNFVITGGVSFNSLKFTSNIEEKENRFSFDPKAGYFVSDNIIVGLAIGGSSTKRRGVIIENDVFKVTTVSIGPFGRYYFTPTNKFSVFTELGLSYITSKSEGDTGFSSIESKADGFGASFAPGISYFVSNSFALEASLGLLSYASVKDDAPDAEPTEAFGIGLSLSNINLGLVYRF